MSGSVLLVGATGLVGGEILKLLNADPGWERVVVLARRRLVVPITTPTLEAHIVDFETLELQPELFAVNTIICALGTTIRQAGSQDAFRKVDFEYPLTVARLGLEAGATHLLLVSALGADSGSGVFYNRVKGELEEAIRTLGYPALTIVRPSLLLGDRDEFRLGERIASKLAWAVPRKFKPVPASAVAATLAREARSNRAGVRVIESAEIGQTG